MHNNLNNDGLFESITRDCPKLIQTEGKFLSGKDSETLFCIALLQHDVFVTQKVLANYLKLKENHEEVLKTLDSISKEP